MKKFINCMKSFYGHEHLGSISSMGSEGALFNCDTIKGYSENNADIFDLIYSPYLGNNILQNDTDCSKKYEHDFEGFVHALSIMEKFKNRGVVKALDIALKDLYNVSLWEMKDDEMLFDQVNKAVKENYKNYYSWYVKVLKSMNCEGIVRTVHPHYLLNSTLFADVEETLVTALVRVDSVIGYIENGKLNLSYFAKINGIEPKTVDEFEENIDYLFDIVDKKKVVGLKQFQAYMRTLSNPLTSREQAINALKDGDYVTLQNYLLHIIYKKADERNLVFQIHTGMTNLGNSDPKLLEPLFSMYPNIKFVLLHCYPFTKEAAYLASVYKNVYLDTSWLVLQGEAILEDSLREYLSIVPMHKIMLSCDATNLEEFYGADRLTKNVLTNLFRSMENKGYMDKDDARSVGKMLMYENSCNLYRQ